MGLIGRALAKFHLTQQGYFVSFDVLCTPEKKEAQPYRFDIAGIRIEDGKITQAVIGILRAWWFPSAHLTPSMIRQNLKPAIPAALSDEAVRAFRRHLDLGFVPVDRLLFFSHASPEKSDEAEDMLRAWNIETVYLERVAARLQQMPAYGTHLADPFITQIMSLLRGAAKSSGAKIPAEEKTAREIISLPTIAPQLEFGLFRSIPAPDTSATKHNDDE